MGICGGAANEDECSQRYPQNSKSLVLHAGSLPDCPTNTTADDRIVIEITVHTVRLMPPAYVKRYVKRQKNASVIAVQRHVRSWVQTGSDRHTATVPRLTDAVERMLLAGEPVPSVSDVEHKIKYASLVCRSPEAAERFIHLCETMAEDLLRPYGDLLIGLSTVLRIKRTLDGAEIDEIISDVLVRNTAAVERRRREDWRIREMSAKVFRLNVITPLPHCPQDRRTKSATR